jgi:hypothetical protein
VGVGVVEVGYGGIYIRGSAGAEVLGDGGELFFVAGYEEEACALGGPDAAGGFSDAGGGAEDEDFFWGGGEGGLGGHWGSCDAGLTVEAGPNRRFFDCAALRSG